MEVTVSRVGGGDCKGGGLQGGGGYVRPTVMLPPSLPHLAPEQQTKEPIISYLLQVSSTLQFVQNFGV